MGAFVAVANVAGGLFRDPLKNLAILYSGLNIGATDVCYYQILLNMYVVNIMANDYDIKKK